MAEAVKAKTVTAEEVFGTIVYLRRHDNRVVPFIVAAVNKGGTIGGTAFDVKRTGGTEEIRIVKIGTREGECWPSLSELNAAIAFDTAPALNQPTS